MKGRDKILFSERFEEVFRLLGTFSYMYALTEGSGICLDALVTHSHSCKDIPSLVKLLEKSGIIYRRNGLLHLNVRLFYSMTVLDLLLLTDPWLDRGAPPGNSGDLEQLFDFCRSEPLSLSFIV